MTAVDSVAYKNNLCALSHPLLTNAHFDCFQLLPAITNHDEHHYTHVCIFGGGACSYYKSGNVEWLDQRIYAYLILKIVAKYVSKLVVSYVVNLKFSLLMAKQHFLTYILCNIIYAKISLFMFLLRLSKFTVSLLKSDSFYCVYTFHCIYCDRTKQ